ncbi:S8 family peptidase [Flavitalea antarctica]
MRNLLIAASAASLLLLSCTKKNSITDDTSPNQLSSTALSSNRVLMDGQINYIVLSKQQALSSNLLEKIAAIGSITSKLDGLGIVVASSSNPGFEQELEKLAEVQNVVRDIQLDWLKSTLKGDKIVDFDETQMVNESLESSASLGLSGTNPFVPLQWSLSSVNSKGAFQAGYKGKGAVVAVLDGGFHLTHPDIVNNVIGSKTFVPGQAAQMANPGAFSHGTHVAGIVAASDNNIGIAGIAPEAKLMLVKVLGDNGSGAFSWIIEGVYYAANQGADIINMSLGGLLPRNGQFVDNNGTPNDPTDDVKVSETKEVQDLITSMNRAFQYARKKGSLAIVAAGNDGIYVTGQGQGTFYPANCVDVVTIAANAPNDWALNENTSLFVPSSYTNYGSSLISFAGPGGDFDASTTPATVIGITRPSYVFDMVLSAGSSTGYSWAAGTSMACPAASGVAALLVGKYNGDISTSQLESKLKSSAVDLGAPGKDPYFGNGQVNAANVVKQ